MSKANLSQSLNQFLSNQKSKSLKEVDCAYTSPSNNLIEEHDYRLTDYKTSHYETNNSHSLELINNHITSNIKENPEFQGNEPNIILIQNFEDSNQEYSDFYLKNRNSEMNVLKKMKTCETDDDNESNESITSAIIDDKLPRPFFESHNKQERVLANVPSSVRQINNDIPQPSNLEIKIENENTNPNTNLSPRIKVSDILGFDKNINFATSPRSNIKQYKITKSPMKSRSPNPNEIRTSINLSKPDQQNHHISTGNIPNENDLYGIKCFKHKDYDMNYICLKDNCGEILCSQCIIQHSKLNHAGIYKKINEFLNMHKSELENEQCNHQEIINKISTYIQKLKSNLFKDNNLNTMLNLIEENMIAIIREYFNEIKREINDFYINDIEEMIQDLEAYKENLSEVLYNINKDLESCTDISKENIVNVPKMFKRNYEFTLKDNIQKLKNYDDKVKALLDNVNQPKKNTNNNNNLLYVDPDLDKKFLYLLNHNIYKKIDSVQKSRDTYQSLITIQEKLSEQHSSSNNSERFSIQNKNEELLAYYQNLYKYETKSSNTAKHDEEKLYNSNNTLQNSKNCSEKKNQEDIPTNSRVFSQNTIVKNDLKKTHCQTASYVVQILPNQQQQFQNLHTQSSMPRREIYQKAQKNVKRAKTISPLKEIKAVELVNQHQAMDKISKGISHKSINACVNFNNNISDTLFFIHDKDLDSSKMRIVLTSLCDFFKSQKIKVFDSNFVPSLLNLEEISSSEELENSSIYYENVRELLANRNGKHRSVFQAYEKVFFPVYIINQQWILVEIKTIPKTITVYDSINKSIIKNKNIDNLLNIFQELIKLDYKDKFNQMPDFINQWEKRACFTPSLIVKNLFDTGILMVKIISNAFQHKEFSTPNISAKEMNIIRKKIEKFLKCREDHNLIDKLLPFQCFIGDFILQMYNYTLNLTNHVDV